MNIYFPRQGSLRASLFILAKCILLCAVLHAGALYAADNREQQEASQSALAAANQAHLAENSQWLSLLHFSQNTPHITDPHFLLSANHFSPTAELQATIDAFYGPDRQEYLCRFPARYFWLAQRIVLPELSFAQCKDLIQFEQKAPADKIAIVYASENIAQPSSMMGHLFLKISGVNDQAQIVEHAISFYTEIKTLNIPKLMYDSMLKGKKGFFTLTPYSEKVNMYVHKEQRNLWEFELNLSDEQRHLIQLHLYELKSTEFTYFFQSYNCATVISFISSLVIPELREPEGVWVTPLDIAKKINTSSLVQRTKVEPSNRWQLRMLQTQLSANTTHAIKSFIEFDARELPAASNDNEKFFNVEMARSYNDFRFEKDIVKLQQWNTMAEKINSYDDLQEQHIIDLSQYKNPLKTPQDSQLWLGVAHQQNDWYLRAGILPASHSLEDDNRQYFGETGLHLAALSLLTNLQSGNTRLERFELYAAESIIPYDSFTGGISGRFAIGVEPIYDRQLAIKKETFIKGALGYTYDVAADMDVYALAGVGLGHADSRTYLYATPELGIIVREVFNMKSILSMTQNYHQLNDAGSLAELHFTQAKYFNQEYALFFHAKRVMTDSKTLAGSKALNSYDLTLKKYF